MFIFIGWFPVNKNKKANLYRLTFYSLAFINVTFSISQLLTWSYQFQNHQTSKTGFPKSIDGFSIGVQRGLLGFWGDLLGFLPVLPGFWGKFVFFNCEHFVNLSLYKITFYLGFFVYWKIMDWISSCFLDILLKTGYTRKKELRRAFLILNSRNLPFLVTGGRRGETSRWEHF